jgi:hypothetical protein
MNRPGEAAEPAVATTAHLEQHAAERPHVVLGAVVRLEPPWAALPQDVPPPVRTLVQRRPVKDPHHRVANISTARFVAMETGASLAATPGAAADELAAWREAVRADRLGDDSWMVDQGRTTLIRSPPDPA